MYYIVIDDIAHKLSNTKLQQSNCGMIGFSSTFTSAA